MKTTTSLPLSAYRVVFDNNCPLCAKLAAWGEGSGLIPKGRTVGFDYLPEESRNRVDAQRFKHEFALLGPAGEYTRYGLEAITKVLSYKNKLVGKVKPGTLLFRLLEPFYHTLADNRYLFVPKPKSAIKCDCEPPFNLKWRLAFSALVLLVSIGIALAVAAVMSLHDAFPATESMARFFAVVTPGWVVFSLTMWPVLGYKRWADFMVQLSIVKLVGVLYLLPLVALWWLPASWFAAAMWLCIGMSFLSMLRSFYKRMAPIGNQAALTAAWAVTINAVALLAMLNLTNPLI